MSEQSKKMYGNSPKMERNDKGDMAVKKGEAKDSEGAKDNGVGEGVDVHNRHMMERMDLHHKHQHEHHTHDNGKNPDDKKELHKRHEEELAMLHKKHEKELGKK